MRAAADSISLRLVSSGEKEMIFKWRNTPFLIKHGSSGKGVTWEEHCRWFDSVLNGEDISLFIIEKEGTPVGQVRFDLREEAIYMVSIYLLEEYTGRGIGIDALRRGLELMKHKKSNRKFIAFIKTGNRASRSVFLKAGFDEIKDFKNVPPGHIAMAYNPENLYIERPE